MQLEATMTALADPTRRALLRRLAESPCRAGTLAQGFAISRPAICKHTRLLTQAGLIRASKRGRERIYELVPQGGEAIRDLIRQLQEVGSFWDAALRSFKRYVEGKAS
jgi:DNA-binding transcriptional ArsR family regulator